MPLYDFKCSQCGKELELLLPHRATNPACPVCGNEMDKQITKPAGFEFKGSGFYATDSKHKK